MTALLVVACILAHLGAAGGTNYLMARLDMCHDDATDRGFRAVGCVTVWPLMLAAIAVTVSGRIAEKHETTWKQEALARRKLIEELQEEIVKLRALPPTPKTGAYR